MTPQFKVGDTVTAPLMLVAGWVEDVYFSNKSNTFVYAVKDAEDDHVYLFKENELLGV